MRSRNKKILPSLLKELWRIGFFSEARDLAQIESELGKMGYNFPASSLPVTLMRSVGIRGFLSRSRNFGNWKYIQKIPFEKNVEHGVVKNYEYDFHPRVKEVSFKQFQDGYFKEAIQNALVEVIDQVKNRTGNPKNSAGRELDGDDLMNQIFGCDNQIPKIKFNELKTSLDKAEQRGIMNLFKGIVGIRDRKSHLNYIQNDPLKTTEYLCLASLLMRLLDENAPYKKSKRR